MTDCATPVREGKLFLLSAPSGAGKTTIVNRVIFEMRDQFLLERVITYTSRPAREGEIDGVDYFFLSPEVFKQKIEQHFFMEWSCDYGAYYGSAISVLDKLAKGTSLIAILDQRGVASVLALHSAVAIWIEPPSVDDLQERLEHRGLDQEEQIAFRVRLAAQELTDTNKLALFNYKVKNIVLDTAVAQVKDIISKELKKG